MTVRSTLQDRVTRKLRRCGEAHRVRGLLVHGNKGVEGHGIGSTPIRLYNNHSSACSPVPNTFRKEDITRIGEHALPDHILERPTRVVDGRLGRIKRVPRALDLRTLLVRIG